MTDSTNQRATCELLLLRHGIAEDGEPDATRPLSPEGHRRTAAVLERLLQLGLGADQLCSSPLLRARQTAELALAAGLAPGGLALAEALAPGGAALAWLQGLAAGEGLAGQRLALVGHEPDLGDLAAALIGAPAGSLQLKKAGVALLRWQPGAGPGRLLLLATPKLLLQ